MIFKLLGLLVSDRAQISSSSFFFFRGLSKGRGGGVPRETLRRARYNDEEERERERERERETI